MEGWKIWRRNVLATIGSAGLFILGTPDLRADMLYASMTPVENDTEKLVQVEFVAVKSAQAPNLAAPKVNETTWETIRADVTRSLIETAMTMFFIRGGTPPATPPNAQVIPTPPAPGGNGGGDTPPPPPPTGGGETPPGTPLDPPPPQDAPEPASLITALLGAGLASTYGWRKRRTSAKRA